MRKKSTRLMMQKPSRNCDGNENYTSQGNGNDPFDGVERPVIKKIIDMMVWHPRILPNQLPAYLHEYRVLHFIGEEKQHDASHSVYELYHLVFDCHSDRMSLSACLSKGETITIWEKEKPTATSAITFLQRENSVLVLFLATLVDYQSTGMTLFLLSIMHQVVKWRVGCVEVNVFLKANPTQNRAAWAYYKRRNFSELKEGPEAFPKVLRDCFADEVDGSPLYDYLVFSKDLKWLTISLTRQYFSLPTDADKKRVFMRLFYNPTDETNDCSSVYAAFPGNLTSDEVTHCTPTYGEYSKRFWDEKAFYPSASNPNKEIYQGPSARFTWIERCLRYKGDSLSPHFLDIALRWLQRYCTAEIWSAITIIPTAIMTAAFTMETTFISYIEARKYVSTLPAVDRQRNKEVAKHIYHSDIDAKRFMEASATVVGYILQNKELFTKPFIAIAAQDYEDFSWTAFVSVHCARIGDNGGDTRCGYFHFDPTGRNRRDPPPRCRFFLKLAHWILEGSNDGCCRKKAATSQWKDSVVAPWFTKVFEFYKRFTEQRLNFGCVINDNDNEKCDINDGRFVQLAFLLPNYMFCSTKAEEKKETQELSGIKSLIFIHDFCVMVHNNAFDKDGKVVGNITVDQTGHVNGMGSKIPVSKRAFSRYINDVQISMYQLTDRIASIQMGSLREESEEYKHYLCPGKTVQKRLSLGTTIQRPKPEEAFPDLAKYLKWTPALAPEEAVVEEVTKHDEDNPGTKSKSPRKSKGKRNTPPMSLAPEEAVVEEVTKHDEDNPGATSKSPRKSKGKRNTPPMSLAPEEAVVEEVTKHEEDNPGATSKSPRKSKGKRKHDEAHEMSTGVSGRTNQKKKARGEVKKLQTKNQDLEIRQRTAETAAALLQIRQRTAETAAAVTQTTSEHIGQCASIFRNEYRNATSEGMKNSLCWQVLQVLQQKEPLSSVDNRLKCIRDELEKEEEKESIIMILTENDVVGGRGERLCNTYLDRTLEFKNMFLSAGTNVQQRREVVTNLYMTLKGEGCRFLDKMEDGTYKEKDIISGKKFVHRRMVRLSQEKELDLTTLPQEVLEARPVPFQSETTIVPPNGIVKHRRDRPRRHAPNKFFRRTIQRSATTETYERATKEEKEQIALGVMDEMRDNGLTFVNKEENIWKDMDTNEVKTMVKTYLQKASRHSIKQRARANWEVGAESAADEEDGDEDAGDESSVNDADNVLDNDNGDNDNGDNNRCIECNVRTSHSCQGCKRYVCSICCETKRGLEMAWWCEECFKKLKTH
jgi:hypothetical protein